MQKSNDERDLLIEQVETAMLGGAFRVVDIVRAVPAIKTRATAERYMAQVYRRWANRQTDGETERQRLIDTNREIIRRAWQDVDDTNATARRKLAAMRTILAAQEQIAKLLGLHVLKVEHSGSIASERNAAITELTEAARRHSIRGMLAGLN